MSRNPLIRGFEGYVFREKRPEEQPPVVEDFLIPVSIAEDTLRLKKYDLQYRLDQKRLPTVIDEQGNRWAWAADIVDATETKAPRAKFAQLETVMVMLNKK